MSCKEGGGKYAKKAPQEIKITTKIRRISDKQARKGQRDPKKTLISPIGAVGADRWSEGRYHREVRSGISKCEKI